MLVETERSTLDLAQLEDDRVDLGSALQFPASDIAAAADSSSDRHSVD
jgi:hypothetical protein